MVVGGQLVFVPAAAQWVGDCSSIATAIRSGSFRWGSPSGHGRQHDPKDNETHSDNGSGSDRGNGSTGRRHEFVPLFNGSNLDGRQADLPVSGACRTV